MECGGEILGAIQPMAVRIEKSDLGERRFSEQ